MFCQGHALLGCLRTCRLSPMPADPPLTLCAFAKDFQTLFGTLVGFGGVCLTLWFNAHQAEKRRVDEIKHDRNATRIALSSELSVIHESLTTWKDVLDELDGAGETALPRLFGLTAPRAHIAQFSRRSACLLSMRSSPLFLPAPNTIRSASCPATWKSSSIRRSRTKR